MHNTTAATPIGFQLDISKHPIGKCPPDPIGKYLDFTWKSVNFTALGQYN